MPRRELLGCKGSEGVGLGVGVYGGVMDGDEDEDQLVKLWGSVSVGMFYTAVARFIMYPSVNKVLQR